MDAVNRYSDEEVISLFKKAVWEVDQKKLGELKLETKVADLGLDSVVTLEVIGYMEETLAMRIPDEKLARLQTLADLASLVKQLAPART